MDPVTVMQSQVMDGSSTRYITSYYSNKRSLRKRTNLLTKDKSANVPLYTHCIQNNLQKRRTSL